MVATFPALKRVRPSSLRVPQMKVRAFSVEVVGYIGKQILQTIQCIYLHFDASLKPLMLSNISVDLLNTEEFAKRIIHSPLKTLEKFSTDF